MSKPNKPASPKRPSPNPVAIARTATSASTTTSSSARTSAARSGAASTREKLTPQQEEFAQALALGSSQISAYRKATGSKAKPEAAYVTACKWAKLAKVKLRVQELREIAGAVNDERMVYRYEDAMRELDDIKVEGLVRGELSAALGAVRQKTKISGLEVDPRRNAQKPFEGVTDEELDAKIRATEDEIKKLSGSPTRH